MASSGSGDLRVIDVDLGYRKLSKTLADLGKMSSKAGLLRGQASPEVIQYGAENQFGTEWKPARPWLTQAWDAGEVEGYADWIMTGLDSYLRLGNLADVEEGFSAAAMAASDDMKAAIRAGDFEPLSPVTIALKGHDKPLIDSGTLLDSIGWDYVPQKSAFKAADTEESTTKLLLRPKRRSGSRAKKRGRKVGFRRKLGGVGALAKSPGYQGRGIRKNPEKRPNAAAGVASRGVRRKGLSF